MAALCACKDSPGGPARDAGIRDARLDASDSTIEPPRDAATQADASAPALDATPEDAEVLDAALSDGPDVDAGRRPDDFDPATSTWTGQGGQSHAQVISEAPAARTYRLTTSVPTRDGAPQTREVTEPDGLPRLRTGHLWLDAAFALTMRELREASVESLSDGAFGDVACSCFEAGERWTWAWTRDVSYATHLALGWLDPQRAARTLSFAISDRKSGVAPGPPELVQDTGTGGSWPVSVDRVALALGADAVLGGLSEVDAAPLRARLGSALSASLERDRKFSFDPSDGLYRGESSFLDWREQTYPTWAAADPTVIAGSKSLSTNVLIHQALQISSRLAERSGDPTTAARHSRFADDLASSIRGELSNGATFASGKGGAFDPSPFARRDLLGESLLILSGIVSGQGASALVASYPRGDLGPPVVWPQVEEVPIYHNQATWPFVTAYSALAARTVFNEAAFESSLEALLAAIASTLTNPESLEVSTGAWFLEAGARSGPVVSSRRQLWSVAGFASVVMRGIFGVTVTPDALELSPFLGPRLRQDVFASVDAIELRDLPVRGSKVTLTLELPDPAATGPYSVGSVMIDGAPSGPSIPFANLAPTSRVIVRLIAGASRPSAITRLSTAREEFFAPREPNFSRLSEAGGHATLSFGGESGLTFEVWRDGSRIASGVPAGEWTDPEALPGDRAPCYSVRAVRTNGLASHSAPPQCAWGDAASSIVEGRADSFVAQGGVLSSAHGELHYDDWGDPEDSLEVTLTPARNGRHLVQVRYGNGAGPVSTGLAACVKWASVLDAAVLVGEGPLVMPQLGSWDRFQDSTTFAVELTAGRPVRIRITDADNMSSFERARSYSGSGGGAAPFNRANISVIRLLAIGGE